MRFHVSPLCVRRPAAAQPIGLSVSVNDKSTANERVVTLLSKRAASRFLSCEPMIGPIDLKSIMLAGRWIDAFAGASGPKARHMHTDWVRGPRNARENAYVPFFFKQWGGWAHRPDLAHFQPMLTCECQRPSGRIGGVRPSFMGKEGKKTTGCLLDVRAHDEFPELANE